MGVKIHRGAHEIGGSCVEVEARGQRLVLDVGRPLSASRDEVVPLPDVIGFVRRSELLGLRWKAIDSERGAIAIRQVLVLVAGKPHFKDAPKSPHGFRTIWIPPRMVAVLRDARRRQTETRLASPVWHDHDLVFCRDDGNPWHPDHVTETVREMVVESGLPRIRPLQDLRHTHATLLLADGENPKVVQERLGHHSHSFTADTYQHVMPGMDEAAATRFDGLVFGDGEDDEADEPHG